MKDYIKENGVKASSSAWLENINSTLIDNVSKKSTFLMLIAFKTIKKLFFYANFILLYCIFLV